MELEWARGNINTVMDLMAIITTTTTMVMGMDTATGTWLDTPFQLKRYPMIQV